jgi:ABC-2 type transport system ATP-binding protein/lipopolysaccharide transport system ATP-binding protein
LDGYGFQTGLMNFPIGYKDNMTTLKPVGHIDNQAVVIEKVGVRYRVPSEAIGSFKEYAIRRLQRKVQHRDFWALDDISFSVNRGAAFGIIGHNGAGKSTLLKLIARVFRPTSGRVLVNGQVAPLLEFGAGFHPELTGRENIFLNGALLGFSRQEMKSKFDRIVDFAELWEFIDVPLRTYSSGMWARLGFAVATDIKPDILIIDEVLSVGDEAFQQKCFNRLHKFREQGATVILVSHNMETIQDMCDQAAWLDHGKLKALGDPQVIISKYRMNQGIIPQHPGDHQG